MAWLGSPTTHRSSRPPSQHVSRWCWSGFTSWNSSTNRWRKRHRCASAKVAVLLHGPRAVGQQVVEVDDPSLPLLLLVGPEERTRSVPREGPVRRSAAAAACAYPAGLDPPRLRPLDLRRELRHRHAVACARGCRPSSRALRSSSTGRRPALGTGPARELGQRDRVEGARRGPIPQAERGEPRGELGRRLPGEGEGEDVPGVERAGGRPVRDAAGEDPRLARPGPGQDAHRVVVGGDGAALRRVQPGQQHRAIHWTQDTEQVLDVSRERFEELVADGLDACPTRSPGLMDNVVVMVEDGRRAGSDGSLRGRPAHRT